MFAFRNHEQVTNIHIIQIISDKLYCGPFRIENVSQLVYSVNQSDLGLKETKILTKLSYHCTVVEF